MASSPVTQPHNQDEDNVYCSDPNCPYCADLRQAEEHWKKDREQRERSDAA